MQAPQAHVRLNFMLTLKHIHLSNVKGIGMGTLIILFLKGFALGLSIAIPFSPLNIWCMYLSLNQGIKVGCFSSFGASTAEAFYSLVAGFGITTVSSYLIQQQTVLNLIGGLTLGYLGIKIVVTQSARDYFWTTKYELLAAYTLALFLALTNPITILSLIAIFSGLGVAQASDTYASAMTLIGGIFFGSMTCRCLLNVVVGFIGKQVTTQTKIYLKKGAGLIILGFALFILSNLFM